ncbi:MAG: hypothetical protein ACXVYW_04600 [Oryzihumus sp.]
MSTTQWILNLGLLAWVLLRNLGSHRVTRGTSLVPAVIVLVVGGVFLQDVPSAGNDTGLELIGLAGGAVLGVVAAALTRVRREGQEVVVRAGVAFAALWVVVIGGRVAFAEWATGAGSRTVGEFSMRHLITGADAWTVAFVLMALAMVTVRMVVTAGQVALTRRATVAADVRVGA